MIDEEKKERKKMMLKLVELGIDEYFVDEFAVSLHGSIDNEIVLELAKKGFSVHEGKFSYFWGEKNLVKVLSEITETTGENKNA